MSADSSRQGDEQCCVVPVLASQKEYVPTGTTIQLPVEGKEGEMDVYVTTTGSEGASKKALICIYDIFGLHPSTLRGADLLSRATGIQVYVPDFFRGKGWKTDNVPPKEGRPAMQAHIQSIGSWEVLKPDLHAVVEHVGRSGADKIGAYGFCFGGKKLAQAASDPLASNLFTSIALIHPTNVVATDGELFNTPVALLPSGGEDPLVMDAIWEKVKDRKGSVRRDFLDDTHGFASARSQWDGAEKEGRVREAYDVLAGFFKETL